ncbi:MAG: hypothetical protein Roseis2KO_03390 [Roseivirga sp.]
MSSVTEIRTPDQLHIVSDFEDKARLEFLGNGDLIIKNEKRQTGGRVVVVGSEKKLFFNFGNDFSGGLYLDNTHLSNLEQAPAGMQTTELVVGDNGKIYKK